MKPIAIFPGSFDPWHKGHQNVVKQALPLFRKIYIVVTNNVNKVASANCDVRARLISKKVKDIPKVSVCTNPLPKLSVEVARTLQATYIIRGIRSVDDMHDEINLSHINSVLDAKISTIFLVSDYKNHTITSRLLREAKALKNE